MATRNAATVVVAPAGAGKSLGVAGWLQRSVREVDALWLTGARSTTRDALESALETAQRGRPAARGWWWWTTPRSSNRTACGC